MNAVQEKIAGGRPGHTFYRPIELFLMASKLHHLHERIYLLASEDL